MYGITDSMDMSLSKLQKTVKDRGGWRAADHGITKKMSGQVSRGSAGEYQANERAGVAWLSWRVSGR